MSQKNKKRPQNRSHSNKSAKQAVLPKEKSFSRWWLLPLAFIVVIVPLITVIHKYDCGLEKNAWFSIGGTLYDFFLYYKAFFLRLACVAVLFVLAYLIPFSDHGFLKEKKTIAPSIAIGAFGLFSLASCLLSDNKLEAFFGGYEQFEGWFIILCYIGCFYLAFGYIRTTRLIRFLLDVLLIGAALIGVLGTFQAIGVDWIQSDWAKPILASEISNEIDMSTFSIRLNFGSGVSYATLYNPNYVGSYVALLLPYTAYLIFRGEKIWRRLLAGATSIMLVVTLIASQSLTGIIGLMAGAFVCAVLLIPFLKKTRPILIGVMALAIAGAVAIVIIHPGFMSKLFKADEYYNIDSMVTKDNQIRMTLGTGRTAVVTLPTESDTGWAQGKPIDQVVKVTDENGNPIHLKSGELDCMAYLDQEGYPPLKFTIEAKTLVDSDLAIYLQERERLTGESPVASVSSDESGTQSTVLDLFCIVDEPAWWAFSVVDHKVVTYNEFGRFDQMREIPKLGFEGKYHFGSRRGYIWSHTFPLLTDYLLVGAGRDQFINAYPNDDYVGKKYMDYSTQTITKPHNQYLQIWTQDGLPALLGFVFLYILFIVRTLRRVFGKNRPTPEKGVDLIGFIIITAVASTAYMVVGLANDSTITTAPIYWVVLGAGYAAEAALPHDQAV